MEDVLRYNKQQSRVLTRLLQEGCCTFLSFCTYITSTLLRVSSWFIVRGGGAIDRAKHTASNDITMIHVITIYRLLSATLSYMYILQMHEVYVVINCCTLLLQTPGENATIVFISSYAFQGF